MLKYLLRRILMMVPTLFGITLLSFLIINMAPGGPIEQRLQQLRWGSQGDGVKSHGASGDSGVSEQVLEDLKRQYGFDKPVHIRYLIWVKNVFTFDFGDSFKFDEPVIETIKKCLPVSLQFGILSIILTYLVCIPLGILKAVKNGSHFDSITSFILFLAYSVPPLMLGVLLIVFFAGGSYFNFFPNNGIMSDNYAELSTWGQILDRAHHFVLPMICYMVNSFTVLTLMMKNSLLEEIKLDYVRTARAKGLSENIIIYKHALRNALIPIVTGVGSFLGVFFH
jgi:microcin C transport system permease protein